MFNENNDFNSIMERLLNNVDDSLDKRQGSIIYDALAPAALELAQCYAAMEIFMEQTYLKTATGINLDNRVADYGLIREEATYAIREIEVIDVDGEPMDLTIGDRFSIPAENGGYNYEVIEKIATGRYKSKCETPGTVGNEYQGILLPLYNIQNLGQALLTTIIEPAQDIESDASLRKRAEEKLTQQPFGGNMTEYRLYVDGLLGIGAAKIFPVWDGGGTVKISIVTSDYETASQEFINKVQTIIDPIKNHGEGMGLAPIGHTVTVTTPTAVDINVTARLLLLDGYVLNDVRAEIENNIKNYIKEVQSNWEDSENTLTIYLSRLISVILAVTGVTDVQVLKINGSEGNLVLTQNKLTQQFPKFKSVVLEV